MTSDAHELFVRLESLVQRWNNHKAAFNDDALPRRPCLPPGMELDGLIEIAGCAFAAPSSCAEALCLKARMLSILADDDGDLVHQLARALGDELTSFLAPELECR